MEKINENTKVTLTFGQLNRLVKEAKSKFDTELVSDGNKLVKEAIETLEQNAENIEKITRLRELLSKFTGTGFEKARQAKAASSAAAAQVKADSKPLDDAAKEITEMLKINNDVFFSAKQNGRKVGIIVTYVKPTISQDDSNEAILKRLEDPNFLANNKQLAGISEEALAILEKARDLLRKAGLFNKGPDKLVPKAQGLYEIDPETDEFVPLREGFKDFIGRVGSGIKSTIRQVGEWFQRVFLPRYSRKEEKLVEVLDKWNEYVSELASEVRGAQVAERRARIRRVREARLRKIREARRRLTRH